MDSFEKWLRKQHTTTASNSNAAKAARKAWNASLEHATEVLKDLVKLDESTEEALESLKSSRN